MVQEQMLALVGALSALKFTGRVHLRDDGALEASCGGAPVRITLATAGAAGETAVHIVSTIGKESRPWPSTARGLSTLAGRIQAVCDSVAAAEARARDAVKWCEELAPLAAALTKLPFEAGLTAKIQPSGHLEVTIVTRDLPAVVGMLEQTIEEYVDSTIRAASGVAADAAGTEPT